MTPFEPRRKKKKSFSMDWMVVISIAILFSLVIRLFLYEPFDVIGSSMQPTLQSGDFVIVNKWIYRFEQPQRGDVVVFHALEEKDYIKRVIALPGEKVEMRNGQLMINGKVILEPYLPSTTPTDDFEEQTVPEGSLFVLGDNRQNSRDSRDPDLGAVSMDELVGRVDFVYWPFTRWKMLN